jgi:Na+-translocating ferredoxin:NAD+ oxidoreductase RnfA subunit
MLAIFSGLSMNLILQLGLGLKGIAVDVSVGKGRLLAGSGILFVTVTLLWLIFSFARSVFFLGLFEYVILFPASSLVFFTLECFVNRFILKVNTVRGDSSKSDTLPGGPLANGALSGAALFITLNVAGNAGEAIVLSLGFACSMALVFVVAGEIRRRSGMEAVPHSLRGGPLALIAMGLLSLVFSSGALMLFGVLGTK